MLFDYPKQAYFGRTIPKTKFYEHAKINTATKNKFVSQIEKIIWSYKLATATLNLDSSESVPEIQIIDIQLKGDDISEDVLRTIDKAISFPIIFQIHKREKVKIKAAYKRPSDSEKGKWVLERYFETEWMAAESPKEPLPVAIDLPKLYEKLLQKLMPQELITQANASTIREQVALIEQIQIKERAFEQLKAKRDREKQFNRKTELNRELKQIRQEIEELKCTM